MSFLRELWSVLTSSNYCEISFRNKKGRALVQAVFLYFVMMALYIIALKYIDQWFDLPPHKAFEFLSKNSWQSILLLGIVIVPLIEELTFRLALKFTPLNLSISLGLLLYLVISILSNSSFYKLDEIFIVKLSIVIVFSIVLYLIFRRLNFYLQHIWGKYHIFIIFFAAFIFAFLHFRNLSVFSVKNLLLMPIIVLPQLALSLLASYFRLAYGLLYSIILHSIINAGPIFFLLVIR